MVSNTDPLDRIVNELLKLKELYPRADTIYASTPIVVGLVNRSRSNRRVFGTGTDSQVKSIIGYEVKDVNNKSLDLLGEINCRVSGGTAYLLGPPPTHTITGQGRTIGCTVEESAFWLDWALEREDSILKSARSIPKEPMHGFGYYVKNSRDQEFKEGPYPHLMAVARARQLIGALSNHGHFPVTFGNCWATELRYHPLEDVISKLGHVKGH